MKIKAILLVLPLLIFSACQSTQAETSILASHFPVETASNSYDFAWPILSEKIEAPNVAKALSIEAVLISSWEEIEADLLQDDRGYTASTFEVHLDQNGLLSLTIWTEFTGAHLSQSRYDLNFDLSRDLKLSSQDLIISEKQAELATLIDRQLQDRIQEKVSLDPPLSQDLFSRHFTSEDLNHFIFHEDGIEWSYDFGFPHVSKAGEPESSIKLSYAELESFLQPEISAKVGPQ